MDRDFDEVISYRGSAVIQMEIFSLWLLLLKGNSVSHKRKLW